MALVLPFSDIVMLASIASASLCLWLFVNLCRLPDFDRRRLFWLQFVALCVTDLGESLAGIMCAHVPPPSSTSCFVYISVRYVLEFASCMLETQIAAGFTASCFHAERTQQVLRHLIFIAWPFGGAMLIVAMVWGMQPTVDTENSECNDRSGIVWAIVVLSCCGSAILLYAAAFLRTLRVITPGIVRRRALLRGLTYVMNFLVTFGPKAVLDLVPGTPLWLRRAGWGLLCLNGAVNAGTYWILKKTANRSVAFVQADTEIDASEIHFHLGSAIGDLSLTLTCRGSSTSSRGASTANGLVDSTAMTWSLDMRTPSSNSLANPSHQS